MNFQSITLKEAEWESVASKNEETLPLQIQSQILETTETATLSNVEEQP